jgi:hypothetical protein
MIYADWLAETEAFIIAETGIDYKRVRNDSLTSPEPEQMPAVAIEPQPFKFVRTQCNCWEWRCTTLISVWGKTRAEASATMRQVLNIWKPGSARVYVAKPEGGSVNITEGEIGRARVGETHTSFRIVIEKKFKTPMFTLIA